MRYDAMQKEQLQQEYQKVCALYEGCKAKNLKLDMSRGKPGREQLDLSLPMMDILSSANDCMIDSMDTRNYGELSGLPSCRALFAELLGVRPAEVFAAGNSSLQLMYDTIAKAYTHGLLHSSTSWGKLENVKFLCPVPGYDRHFGISESFGMEMISIPMTPEGPDMDAVEAAVRDHAVKGMWCVPKYSNPEGIIYSDAVVRRIAALKPAAEDFLLMWDNAYFIHEFDGPFVPFPDILSLCKEAGNPDMVFEFASTSKVTLPGAGVAAFAASEANIAYMKSLITYQIISYDKVNQLRHVKFLKNKAHTLAFMQQHAAMLKPRFDTVLKALDEEIAPLGFAAWNRPRGGYFISLDTMPGTARHALALAKEAGVVMTSAGATHPYHNDPKDSNIRIAPTLPPVQELEQAIDVLCVSLRLAALEQLLKEEG